MSDFTWPLPYAFPQKTGIDWAKLKPLLTAKASQDVKKKQGTGDKASNSGSGVPPEDHTAALEGVDKLIELRKRLVDFFAAKSPASAAQGPAIDSIMKPYAQLAYLVTMHFDLTDKGADLGKVSWNDAWTGKSRALGSWWGGTVAESLMATVSTGAALTVSASQSVVLGTVDGYKAAFQAFQQAAGLFQLVANTAKEKLPETERVGTLSPEALAYCQAVAMAGAGHTFVLRAEVELASKPMMLAKLCYDAAAAYDAVAIPNPPLPFVAAECQPLQAELLHGRVAACVLRARAHKYVGTQLFADQDAGNAIAHFEHAKKLLQGLFDNRDPKLASLQQPLIAWVAAVAATIDAPLAKAHERNDSLYFARIPAQAPPIEGTGKAKGTPTAFASLAVLDPTQPNPFATITPRKVAEAVQRFKSTMFKQLAAKTQSVLSSREWANEALSGLGVTGVIQSMSNDPSLACHIPQGLRNKLLALRGDDGTGNGQLVSSLVSLVALNHEVAESCSELLRDATRELDAEKAADEDRCRSYGDRVWRPLRMKSSELPEVARVRLLVKELNQKALSEVVHPLQQLKSQLESNAQGLSRLDWPLSDLDALMPYTKSDEVMSSKADVQELVERLRVIIVRLEQATVVETNRLTEVQQFIASKRAAQTLMGLDPSRFDGALESLQTELIDHYSVVEAAIESRSTLVQEAEQSMLELAAKRSADPVAQEIQDVCIGIERNISTFENATARMNALANAGAVLLDECTLARDAATDLRQVREFEAEEFATTLDRELSARMANIQAAQHQQIDDAVLESRRRQAQLQAQIQQLEAQRVGTSATAQAAGAAAAPMGAAPIVSYDYPGLQQQPTAGPAFGYTVAPYPMYGVSSGPLTGPAPPPPPPPPPPPNDDRAFDAFFV